MSKFKFAGLLILVTTVLLLGGLVFTDTYITEAGTSISMGALLVWGLR